MPGFDGTGPSGMGHCVVPIATDRQDELDYLKAQAKAVRSELQRIEVLIKKRERAKKTLRARSKP